MQHKNVFTRNYNQTIWLKFICSIAKCDFIATTVGAA